MRCRKLYLLPVLPCLLVAEVRNHPGGRELPHEKFIRVVSEQDSPVQQVYIKSKDGLYVAAAIRKPKGNGPFPALVYFHGAPGGRGMDQLVSWSRGATGSPVWERFLQEGFVVAVADYRAPQRSRGLGQTLREGEVSYADDGVAVVEHVCALPYVNPDRVSVYGVSLGGDVTLHTISRVKVRSAILGAPAPISFLGASPSKLTGNPMERWKDATIKTAEAEKGIASIECPVLILVGTADGLIHLSRRLYDLLEKAGKKVRMEVYENGYHDFCIGPQGNPKRKEPLLDATLDALELSVAFLKE